MTQQGVDSSESSSRFAPSEIYRRTKGVGEQQLFDSTGDDVEILTSEEQLQIIQELEEQAERNIFLWKTSFSVCLTSLGVAFFFLATNQLAYPHDLRPHGQYILQTSTAGIVLCHIFVIVSIAMVMLELRGTAFPALAKFGVAMIPLCYWGSAMLSGGFDITLVWLPLAAVCSIGLGSLVKDAIDSSLRELEDVRKAKYDSKSA